MTKMYIENDPYNWFDRLNEMEDKVKDICNREKSIDAVNIAVKNYFLENKYEIEDSIIKDESYRYTFFDKEKEETIVFILEAEMNLYYLSLAIHNELVKDLKGYSTQENPNEFFSMFLD